MDAENKFGFEVTRILDCGFMIEELIVPDIDNIDIGYGMNFVFDINNSWIRIGVRTDFRTKTRNETFLSGTVLTQFGIDKLSGFVGDDNLVHFPDGSLEILFGLAFSHMRAIISKNVSGSRFNNIIIPVVNSAELFNELLQINIDKLSDLKRYIGQKNKEHITVSDFQLKNVRST